MSKNILVVDDEKDIRDSIGIYLKSEGYNIYLAEDGMKALQILESEDIHLIIMDVMMPNLDGINATMKIRESRNIPIIMVTAKAEDVDMILGLNVGADDYIRKPFNPLELVARVKAQMRRYVTLGTYEKEAKNSNEIEVRGLVLNNETKEVYVNGEEVKLSKRTGKTITLNELIDEVGVNASRYFFASKSLDTQMDFDLDLAVKKSNENPIYYIEYANARISSIIRNKEEEEYINSFSTIDNELAYTILNKLVQFEDVVIASASKGLPHLVANFLYELASLFHSYYSTEKIVTDDDVYTKERIALIRAIKIVMNNAANMLGLILREEM